jgi:hypothetical protein
MIDSCVAHALRFAFAKNRPSISPKPTARVLREAKASDLMYKLIAILAAVIPVLLFLKTTLFGKSKVMQQAVSEFRKQIDYVVWAILFIAGSTIVYAVGRLIYSMWN